MAGNVKRELAHFHFCDWEGFNLSVGGSQATAESHQDCA